MTAITKGLVFRLSRFCNILGICCCLCFIEILAAPGTAAQLKSQKQALKNLEKELTQTRRQLNFLENQEKGVMGTLSVLDQNLNQTREYVLAIIENEKTLDYSLNEIQRELDSLDQSIALQQKAMQKRIRELYIQGRYQQWEYLYKLFLKKENPERHAYMVRRLISEDRARVESLEISIHLREEKKEQQTQHLNEIRRLRKKKSQEERGLLQQINNQNTMLISLKTSKKMQQQALREFEQNQKTMISLIRKLEKKRKEEEEAAKRRAAEAKKKKNAARKVQKGKPKEESKPEVVGPKCMPMSGQIISRYGLQEHSVLHIKTRNLGVEIRGKRGQAIKAAAQGTVVMVTEIDGRGPSIIIEHAGGIYSVYGHLGSIRVKEGDIVRNCEEIATAGDIASLNGIKLYFQVSEGTRTIDPILWLKKK